MSTAEVPGRHGLEIAVIGVSCRFPGAESVEAFWHNLRDGVESLTVLPDEAMAAVPAATRRSPGYVRVARTIPDVDRFDAAFFGVNPREADVMDPQHRLFLEGCWAALEDSGYDPERYAGSVGVYAGSRLNFYLMNAYSNPALVAAVGDLMTQIANEKDYLANRVSYKLNLGGPSVVVQSACSTALVAVHMACQGLLAGECDMALAGGVAVRIPEVGYLYRPGDINSPDGRIRAFDAKAQGTIFGTGLGLVVLKRLADALADGDTIHAVIKGSAVSNDGSEKVGFTAPGVDGQYRVIRAALTAAEVAPETVTYVEAHGTGTPVGDPIEVTALTKVFRESTEGRQFCALGSVKPNIGHLGAAAGIASLIKAVLALKHRQIPPSINFERPNPQIDFASSPFFVNTELREWAANGTPRRAGVSAFGMGGTNAHAVLEEAPEPAPTSPSRPWQLLLLSARTETALAQQAENLAAFLEAHPETELADAAFTLQAGRKLHEHRRAVVCCGVEHARQVLAGRDPDWSAAAYSPGRERPVVFLFSGQGAQYAGMGRGLYETEPTFRAHVDDACERLRPHLGLDLRELLFAADGDEEAAGRLAQTRFTQPALFVIEYALARLWMEWGIRPEAMMGHSIGEYVAACLAGVFSLGDALALVAERGRLMQSLPSGAMLAVPLPEAEVLPLLGAGLSLAAVNAPDRCVVSGPHAEVDALRAELEARGVAARPLHTSHAFHSVMMEPILAPFVERFAGVALHAPRIPYVSNVTGAWITEAEATDPAYWARHLRQAVRFAGGVRELCQDARRVLLEVGPGQTLATLARQHPDCGSRHTVLSSLRHPKERKEDLPVLLKTLGQLWMSGVQPDWSGFHLRERRRRIPLPTYPFERQRHWVDQMDDMLAGMAPREVLKKEDVADWFYLPYWKPSVMPTPKPEEVERASRWLVFLDEAAWGEAVVARLAGEGRRVTVVAAGEELRRTGEGRYEIAPGRREDYDGLIKELAAAGALPDCVLHLWSLGPVITAPEELARVPERGFWSLLYLAQALGKQGVTQRIHLGVVSSGVQAVAGEERLVPERALLLGPLKSLAQEYPNLRCVGIDVPWPAGASLAGKLIAETTAEPMRPVAAYRGSGRWVQDYEAVRLEAPAPEDLPLREGGVYLITGGLGGLGLTFAEMLAREYRARLVLLGVTALPDRDAWDEWLAAHGEADRVSQRIRKIREIEALGAEVMVAGADVTDREQMRALVAQATARFGAVHGVIHAAGLAGGGMIQLKTAENARRVLAPKVEGTRSLLAALAGAPLDFAVFCSSTIAVAGGLGQVDYCAANNFLDTLAHDLALAGGPRTVSINWGAWEEVGMAVAAGLTRGASAASPAAPAAAEEIHPLLDRCVFEMADQTIYETGLSIERHWVVREHKVLEVPTVPGTTYLELGRAAFLHHAAQFEGYAPDGGVELRDIFFLSPLLLPEGERPMRVFLEKEGDGFNFRVASLTDTGRGEPGWQPHARGRVAPLAEPPARERYDVSEILARCTEGTTEITGPLMSSGEGAVYWGPHWQSLKRIHLGSGEGLARIELPAEHAGDAAAYGLHPALLDVATGIAGFVQEDSYLPLSYQRVRVHRRLPQTFWSYLHREGDLRAHSETVSMDVLILSDDGEVLVEISHFTMKRFNSQAASLRRAAAPAAEPAAASAPAQPEALPAAEEPARDGILPAEGAEALRRALSSGFTGAQVVVAAKDLHALIAQVSAIGQSSLFAAAAPAAPAVTHERPNIPTPYVAPSTDVERRLAEAWQGTLGIEKVGVNDNFFDLGGDSILGLQLIARATAAGLQLSPDQLFEHQTIAELARVLAAAAPSAAAAPASPFERELLAAHPWLAERIERLRGQGLRPESAAWLLAWESRELAPALDPASWSAVEEPREPVSVRLDAEETRALLAEIPDLQRVRPEEAILASLARTLARGAGGRPVLIGVEVDARDADPAGAGLPRPAGGLSAMLPVLFDLGESGDLAEELRLAKEQLRAAVAAGLDPVLLGGLLGDEDLQRRLAALPSPQVSFAYLGDTPVAGDRAGGALTVTGRLDGEGMRFDWRSGPEGGFSGALAAMAEGFLAELRSLIAVCRSAAVAAYTPSDFPDAELSQEELDKLFS